MNTWHKLFEQKLQEVLNKDNKHCLFATMSPTAQGNCARELIAEEYYAQLEKLDKFEKDLVLKTRDRDVFCDFTLAYEKRIEELEKLEQDFIRVIKQTNPNKPQTKPLSDEEIGDCVDDYFGLMALQHKYIYDIDQVQEYGLKLARAIEERHGIK